MKTKENVRNYLNIEFYVTHRLEGSHGEQVSHHGGESWCQTRLSDEAELQLGQADHVVALFPVPRRNVE